MDTKLEHTTDITKTPPPQMSIEVSSFERELPYLTAQGVPFEVIDSSGDLLRIRITIVDSYSLAAYGIAMSNYGFNMAKSLITDKTVAA